MRAVDLQVVRKDFYQEQGDARFLREMPIAVSRGTIFDRNGEPLAVSTPVESIWANPQQLLDAADTLPAARHRARRRRGRICKRNSSSTRKRNSSISSASSIRTTPKRSSSSAFPACKRSANTSAITRAAKCMAHVLGFTNVDDHGQEGLELAFDDWLAGKPGAEARDPRLQRSNRRNVELLREPKPGRDLTLSIDRRIQYMAYRELNSRDHKNITRCRARWSMLDVHERRNPGDGQPAVVQPERAQRQPDPSFRRNRAVTDVVEPGSTIKAFTIAAALESGKWTPHSHGRHESGLVSSSHVAT